MGGVGSNWGSENLIQTFLRVYGWPCRSFDWTVDEGEMESKCKYDTHTHIHREFTDMETLFIMAISFITVFVTLYVHLPHQYALMVTNMY